MNILRHTQQYLDHAYVDCDPYKVFYVSRLESLSNSYMGSMPYKPLTHNQHIDIEFELACDMKDHLFIKEWAAKRTIYCRSNIFYGCLPRSYKCYGDSILVDISIDHYIKGDIPARLLRKMKLNKLNAKTI